MVEVALLEHCVREELNRTALAPHGGAAAAEAHARRLAGGQVEELDAVNNPEDAAAGTRQVPFSARALDRARRLPGGPAEEVLPPRPGPRGAPALGLHRELRRGGQGRRGRGRRAPLHARPATSRGGTPPTAARSRARSTGSRRRTRSTPRCGSTTTCSRTPNPDDVPEGVDWLTTRQPELARGRRRREARAVARRGRPRATGSSSSASATSVADLEDHAAATARSSTAPSPCATPGPRCRSKRRLRLRGLSRAAAALAGIDLPARSLRPHGPSGTSFNGRTCGSGPQNRGSSPCVPTNSFPSVAASVAHTSVLNGRLAAR